MANKSFFTLAAIGGAAVASIALIFMGSKTENKLQTNEEGELIACSK